VQIIKSLLQNSFGDGWFDQASYSIRSPVAQAFQPAQAPAEACGYILRAVYFSGESMKKEFDNIAHFDQDGIPFPVGKRRPDYRSSSPKRLMPQLQIKVPTLRRWDKKMAVVIDRSFYDSIEDMGSVKDLSNADIAWFVVKYNEKEKKQVLEPDFVICTTLERTVEALTGGTPVSLYEFERRIKNKFII